MTDDVNDSGRVTTREFYNALLNQNDRMDTMERRILTRIDGVTEGFATKKDVEDLEEDVADLKKRNKIIDVALSIGIIFSTTIGAIFGRE